MNSKLTPELAAMAAEYALGVLEGEERAEALRHFLSDPAFAAMVRKWQGRLDPLGEAFAEAPPPDLWAAIEARLDRQPRPQKVTSLRIWQGIAALSSAMAASLLAFIAFNVPAQEDAGRGQENLMVAQLQGADGVLLAASIDQQSGQLNIRVVGLPETEQVPELWVIPDDGVPRSLGLIASEGLTEVSPPAVLKPFLVDGAMLAVSLETPVGAPHAAPSSTPIALGKILII